MPVFRNAQILLNDPFRPLAWISLKYNSPQLHRVMEGMITLSDYVTLAKKLASSAGHSAHLASAHLALTGRLPDHSTVMLDLSQNCARSDQAVSFLRDYDVVIGLTKDIVIQAPFVVFSKPVTDNWLGVNIHLTCPATMSTTAADLPMHKIPNVMLGYWGQHHELYVFFPSLAGEDRWNSQLTEDEMQSFTSYCLDPAVQALEGKQPVPSFQLGDVPRMFGMPSRAEDKRFLGQLLPFPSGENLSFFIRRNAWEKGIGWVGSCFFMHMARGATRAIHHMDNVYSAKEALAKHIRNANLSDKNMDKVGEWWVDVGLEVASREGFCLQWTTLSHPRMVKEVFQIDEIYANRMTEIESPEYTRDLASHLSAVSGCRIEPRPQHEGRYGIKYFQMYTTDRTFVYAPKDKFYGTSFTTNDAMGLTQPSNFVSGLSRFLIGASGGVLSRARVDVRVPLAHAFEVLQFNNPYDFGPEVFTGFLMAFRPDLWWPFKAYRVLGISRALQVLARAPKQVRVTQEALRLTAACVWLINSVNSRPNDGHAERELMRMVLPLTDPAGPDRQSLLYPRSKKDRDEEAKMPFIPLGVIYLRGRRGSPDDRRVTSLYFPQIGSSHSLLNSQTFKALFHASLENVRSKYVDDADASWYDMDEGESLEVVEEAHERFDPQLTETWHQFFNDVMIACSPHLVEYVRRETPKEWKRAFDNIFPTAESKTNAKYIRYPYFRKWRGICEQAGPKASKSLQMQLSSAFSTLRWIPYADEDGVCPLLQEMGDFTRLPLGTTGPAPHVLFKWSEPFWIDWYRKTV
ncbi:hypothetical protein BD779DRAFT_1680415 [Infundibulicybe gibba]|nr:hypothetical protein BD779DRAFT_1680415 [Infundibulicybe gibba]